MTHIRNVSLTDLLMNVCTTLSFGLTDLQIETCLFIVLQLHFWKINNVINLFRYFLICFYNHIFLQ